MVLKLYIKLDLIVLHAHVDTYVQMYPKTVDPSYLSEILVTHD